MACASCQGRTSEVMHFGEVALAGAFLREEGFRKERKYPLSLEFCESCLLLQVGTVVKPETMFDHYFYFSSATETMRKHFESYARKVVDKFNPKRVLEIGCNDGVLMKPLQRLGVDVTGVDPAKNVTQENVINAYWSSGVAKELGQFDLILANNVFAHIPEINDAFSGVANSLTADGSFVFEVNRLDSLVTDLQYDWIYHEHLFYYSLMALDRLLARHGMEVYHLERIGTHAGSIRYYAGHVGAHSVTAGVSIQREREKWAGLDRIERFQEFARQAEEHREAMRSLVASHKKVVGYGACGRTNTMLQWCGFGPEQIAYIVDDAPAKQGFYTPGSHIPIVSKLDDADCLIVFAWSFMQEIEPKLRGFTGKVVIPLPHIYERKEARAA